MLRCKSRKSIDWMPHREANGTAKAGGGEDDANGDDEDV